MDRQEVEIKKKCFTCSWYRSFPEQCRKDLDQFIYKHPDDICKEYKPDKTQER